VEVSGRCGDSSDGACRVQVVKNGTSALVRETSEGEFSIAWEDPDPVAPGWYRVIVTAPHGVIYANPIFLN
jgi:hypothetical protein